MKTYNIGLLLLISVLQPEVIASSAHAHAAPASSLSAAAEIKTRAAGRGTAAQEPIEMPAIINNILDGWGEGVRGVSYEDQIKYILAWIDKNPVTNISAIRTEMRYGNPYRSFSLTMLVAQKAFEFPRDKDQIKKLSMWQRLLTDLLDREPNLRWRSKLQEYPQVALQTIAWETVSLARDDVANPANKTRFNELKKYKLKTAQTMIDLMLKQGEPAASIKNDLNASLEYLDRGMPRSHLGLSDAEYAIIRRYYEYLRETVEQALDYLRAKVARGQLNEYMPRELSGLAADYLAPSQMPKKQKRPAELAK